MIMRSGFLVLLLISFVSVYSLQAADFHCSGVFAPHMAHQHHAGSHAADHEEAHHTLAHSADHDTSVASTSGEKTDHTDCPPHMHSCCSSVFVFQRGGQINLPQPIETEFSENIYFKISAPVLDGPFQPPRLS